MYLVRKTHEQQPFYFGYVICVSMLKMGGDSKGVKNGVRHLVIIEPYQFVSASVWYRRIFIHNSILKGGGISVSQTYVEILIPSESTMSVFLTQPL